ncbi:uncharacterized protein [Nicotiana tomentosiformis]|uniref:uncharacterized protein n=1 Tax=Nicotiana tomentosiformis TaxID=4098 RepID=UPI00388C6843
MVGKDVVKDKGKGSKRKAKRDGDDVLSKKRKVHVDQKCSSSSDLKVNDKVSSLEQLMISSFEIFFKALGEHGASKGNRKDDDHHDSHSHHDTGDIHNDYFGIRMLQRIILLVRKLWRKILAVRKL